MVDLDALRAELEAAGVPCQKMWRTQSDSDGWSLFVGEPGSNSYVQDNGWFALYGDDFDDSALAIIARHVSPQPSPDRAALVERMAEHMWYASLDHFNATDAPVGFTDWADAAESADLMRAEAEAALAAVEAAGGWPPMETTELRPFVGKDVSGE